MGYDLRRECKATTTKFTTLCVVIKPRNGEPKNLYSGQWWQPRLRLNSGAAASDFRTQTDARASNGPKNFVTKRLRPAARRVNNAYNACLCTRGVLPTGLATWVHYVRAASSPPVGNSAMLVPATSSQSDATRGDEHGSCTTPDPRGVTPFKTARRLRPATRATLLPGSSSCLVRQCLWLLREAAPFSDSDAYRKRSHTNEIAHTRS